VTETDDERPTYPTCNDETYGRPCESSYCAGRDATIRAFWQGDCERRSFIDEDSAQRVIEDAAHVYEDDVADAMLALARALLRRADRHRAWAKEGA